MTKRDSLSRAPKKQEIANMNLKHTIDHMQVVTDN